MSNSKENKMGVLPVKRLIVSMSLPMMASMLVQALYNVVDSIFVAQINENALTAVTLAFPLQNLMIALGAGTGVGMNALLSRSLGEKNFDRADRAANTTLMLTFINYFVFLMIGIFAVKPFLMTQTDNEVIAGYGVSYLSIICCCSIGVFCQMTFERMLQSTGRTLFSMYSQMSGAIINIIMDPILIFGMFGAPKMGVAGAALATVFGQVVGSCIGLYCNLKLNPDVNLRIPLIFSPKADIVKEIYYVGVPSILMMSIGSLMTYAMNLILIAFSTTATAVFGVYFKLQSFFFMPVFGLNNGLIPVLAYNLGAKRKDRINEALKFSIALAATIMIIGTITFQIIPDRLLGLFNASYDMISIGKPALRVISLSFPIAGVCIALGSVFQAFSESIYSLAVSIGRQLVVLIPAAWLLAQTGNVNAVWWAFPIAEIASLILSGFFFKRVYGRRIAEIEEG
ncbi:MULTISPECIES: MATE family efflux transporter [unclassified Butyrivibrio]|uniref:MATE family efflux transporter n=1 Tax=unclassified Butyrivibrio TaxID=2639466 RepID=UPI0003B3D275|nr:MULTISPECIES: MATE family efflux transporter [unclassified Butyrivibrio]